MSVPDPLGRDRLAAGAAIYKPPVYGARPPAKPFYLGTPVLALGIIVALLVSVGIYRALTKAEQTPEAATSRVFSLLLAEDYATLRGELCREDRSQVGTNDLEEAGRSAGPLLKAFSTPTIGTVADVSLKPPYDGLQAKQVTGALLARFGTPTTFSVVTVKESGGWRVCLSPGGYALAALDLDVPIGSDLEAPVS